MRTEVTQIYLPSFRAPPGKGMVWLQKSCIARLLKCCKHVYLCIVHTCRTHHFLPYLCPIPPFHIGSYTCCTSGHLNWHVKKMFIMRTDKPKSGWRWQVDWALKSRYSLQTVHLMDFASSWGGLGAFFSIHCMSSFDILDANHFSSSSVRLVGEDFWFVGTFGCVLLLAGSDSSPSSVIRKSLFFPPIMPLHSFAPQRHSCPLRSGKIFVCWCCADYCTFTSSELKREKL